MDVHELRRKRPGWTIDPTSTGVWCSKGAWRVRAATPDDADAEIQVREEHERSRTLADLGAELAQPGY